MKKFLQIGYAVLVTAALAVPAAGMLINRPSDADSETAENRVLSAFPEIRSESGRWNYDYFDELSAWFSEHFAFRPQLVTAYNNLSKTVLHTSPNPDVIIGGEGWLYYAETVADATNSRTLSDVEITRSANALRMMQDYASAHGTQFVFAPAPNKASIYPEHLPARYMQSGDENNLDALMDALSANGVTVCDWRTALREKKAAGSPQLYHALDTHWNGDGAMCAYETLMDTLSADDMGFSAYPRTETRDFAGDLWGMLEPERENPDANAVYGIPQTWKALRRMHSTDDLSITTACADGEGSLLMFRDSFGRALIPLLSQRFAESTYLRASAVPMIQLETSPADTLVYELVERNLSQLVTHAPVMPAPEVTEPADAVQCGIPRIETEESGDYLHVYGLFQEQYADCERVFVTLMADQQIHTYEAFACCETELLGLDARTENGFSLCIPPEIYRNAGALAVTVK